MAWLTKKTDSSKKPGNFGLAQRCGEMSKRKFRPIVELLEERTLLSAAPVQVTFYGDAFFKQGIYDVSFTLAGQAETFGVGLLPVSLSHIGDTPSATPQFETLCVDALDSLAAGTTSFPATPTPAATNLPNGGEIAYLYNHHGYFPAPKVYTNPPTPSAYPLSEAVGLQLAVWELEYGLTNADFTITDEYDESTGVGITDNPLPPGPFDPAAALTYATNFVNEAQGMNETATYLDVSPDNPVPASLQGLLAPTPTPMIVTTASFSAGNVVGSAIPQDSATISGGYSETGSLVFKLTAPDNSVVDTETIAISGDGTYPTNNPNVATQVGTYTWSVSYAGTVSTTALPIKVGRPSK